jgi:CRP-like cAMP-binding protein
MQKLPLFGAVTVDEIFRICDTGRQTRFEEGRLLCKEGLTPESAQFLLNGQVAVTRPGGRTRRIEAPAVLAFQELLEERPMAETVQATDMSVCLTLTSEELQTLLADNSDLVPGLFQMLYQDSQSARVVVKGHPSPHMSNYDNLNPIEKGLALRSIPVFSLVSPDEIIALASITSEIRLTAGADLFTEAYRPAIFALISGELSVEKCSASPIVARASDVIGIYETFAGLDFDYHARIIQEGIALRIDREDLFDLLGQRSLLLRQVLSALFRNQATITPAAP